MTCVYLAFVFNRVFNSKGAIDPALYRALAVVRTAAVLANVVSARLAINRFIFIARIGEVQKIDMIAIATSVRKTARFWQRIQVII